MFLKESTPVANRVLDEWLPKLKLNELKVLLVVIRQTIGWHKETDWISHSQFEKKTGLSRKSISQAIQSLIDRDMILCKDEHEQLLNHACLRRGNKRIFYSCTLTNCSQFSKTSVKSASNAGAFFTKHVKYLPITKETYTKSCKGKNVPKFKVGQNESSNYYPNGSVELHDGKAIFVID